MDGKFRYQLEKEFTDDDWSVVFILETSRQGLKSVKTKMRIKICSCGPRSLRLNDHITETDELRDDSFTNGSDLFYHVLREREQYSTTETGLVAGGTERKKRKTKNLLHST